MKETTVAEREIPVGHRFESRALKPLSKGLFAASVALGHALTAYRHISRIKSTTISPDGNLGGKGYVMPIVEMRHKLYEACEALSAITDTLYDEIKAEHWNAEKEQLDSNTREDIENFVNESQEVLLDPEAKANAEIRDIEQSNDKAPVIKDFKVRESRKRIAAMLKSMASALPEDPGAPRVTHRGPGEGTNPDGTYTDPEPQLELRAASSGLPDGNPLTTPQVNPSYKGKPWSPASAVPAEPLFFEEDAGCLAIDVQISKTAASGIPGDGEPDAARADYYDKNPVSGLPGSDAAKAQFSHDALKAYGVEEDLNTPYPLYDYSATQFTPRKDTP